MVVNIILITIIALSFIGIIFIVLKKIPQLKVLDTETIIEEKESQVKNRIIEERLLRKSISLKKNIIAIFKPIFQHIIKFFKDLHGKIIKLEKEYKKTELSQEAEVKEILEDTEVLVIKDEYEEAEESYIKAIKLDSKNIEAYKGLAELYILKREHDKARESLEYALKLMKAKEANKEAIDNRELAECYFKLSSIHQLEGNLSASFDCVKKAIKREPNNPQYLDLLLKISIILKDKKTAEETFKALKKVDPQNKKLAELAEQVNKIGE